MNDKIKKEAREILDKFSSELKKVKLSPKKQKVQLGGFREELSSPQPLDEKFRKQMFKNAPSKDGDYLIAEKKKW